MSRAKIVLCTKICSTRKYFKNTIELIENFYSSNIFFETLKYEIY